jgi:hypothetical protein
MKVFENLCLRFDDPLWATAPEFAVMDVVLEKHPEIITMAETDITNGLKNNGMGRGDTPSVEQVVRTAIFIEDVSQFRQDSTVIETNIHYPANNSLGWECIKEARRLLEALREEAARLTVRDYRKGAKKNRFKINVTKNAGKRVVLFPKQLKL